jgi:formylglycine-generating enzyme required for sulfatase activity
MGKHEVTFDEYDRFARASGRELPDDNGWGRGRRPAINVSWDEAKAYADWLSQQTGKHYRLPTEGEWEYAARAGASGAFPSGGCINTRQANYDGRTDYYYCGAKTGAYLGRTQPVGSYPANPWSLSEMQGNVWEWVADCWHDNYQGAPEHGTAWEGGDRCASRVVRGGAWDDGPDALRSAFRNHWSPSYRYADLGFRLVQD